MVKFIGFFLIFLTFANSGLSVPVPINGQVQIFTNLPKYSSILDSLKNTLQGSSFKTTIVPKTTNFCSFVNENFHSENDDLLLLISESSSNVEDFCNNNKKSAAIQVSVFVDQLQFRFKNHRGQTTTLPKARIDGNVVDSYMNSIFYNLFESKYLQGTSFSDVEIIRYGFLDFPSWVWLIIGAAISTYIVRHNQHAISETTAALNELEEYKPRELRVAPKKNYSGRSLVPISVEAFRNMMRVVTEFVIDYSEHPEVYDVIPDRKPGFLYNTLPMKAPNEPEPFSDIMKDVYQHIMLGLAHFQHPKFFGYYKIGRSYPDIMAEIVTSTTSLIPILWDACPSLTELEILMINWIGRSLGLPEEFLFQGTDSEKSPGGGVLKEGSSDAILLAMLTARHKFLTETTGKINIECRDEEHKILSKLVAYASNNAHSSAEKAAMLALVHLRPITADKNFSMRGEELEKQILRDIEHGLKPFYVHATLGTTSTCGFDNLKEIVQVAKKYNLWVHVDAAYAGNCWICPEFRWQMEGIKDAHSLNISLHKMFLSSVTATAFFVKDAKALKNAMTIHAAYLVNPRFNNTTDFRNWGTPLCRRTKSLKVWFVMRMYGIEGMQNYVRHMVKLAARYKYHLENDPRVEIIGEQILPLVCFRVKTNSPEDSNKLTAGLAQHISNSRKLLLTYATPSGIGILRFSVAHYLSSDAEVDENYQIFSQLLDDYLLLSQHKSVKSIKFKDDVGIIGSPGVDSSRTAGSNESTAMRSPTLMDLRQRNFKSETA